MSIGLRAECMAFSKLEHSLGNRPPSKDVGLQKWSFKLCTDFVLSPSQIASPCSTCFHGVLAGGCRGARCTRNMRLENAQQEHVNVGAICPPKFMWLRSEEDQLWAVQMRTLCWRDFGFRKFAAWNSCASSLPLYFDFHKVVVLRRLT